MDHVLALDPEEGQSELHWMLVQQSEQPVF